MHARQRATLPRIAIAVGVLILVTLGAWLLPPVLVQPGRAVGWELAQGVAGAAFEPMTSQTTTVVPMVVDWPQCAGGEWLAKPQIVYTPWSVTITMSTTDAFAAQSARNGAVGWCLSGKDVQVQLSEPLGGRQLFDGSRFPAHARTVGDPFRSLAQ